MKRVTTFYFVRHAQSQPLRSQDNEDWSLSAFGLQQAEQLAAVLNAQSYNRVYCSPFLRCRQTYFPLSEVIGLPAQNHPQLRERQLVVGFNQKNYGEVHRKSWHYFDYCLPGCESSRVAQKRIVSLLLSLSKDHPGERVLLLSHGQLLALLLNYVMDSFCFEDQKRIKTPDLYVFSVCEENVCLLNSEETLCEAVRAIGVPAKMTKIKD